jgi:hypothetical protein
MAKKLSPREVVKQNAGYLRQHAKVLMDMPASEQFIGARDAVLHAALIQIAEIAEALERMGARSEDTR